MSQSGPQSALRNIPRVVVQPTWSNIVAATYLIKVLEDDLLDIGCKLTRIGNCLLHCTPLPVSSSESPTASGLSPERLRASEPLPLDFAPPGPLPQTIPHGGQCLGQRGVLGPWRRGCGGSNIVRIFPSGRYTTHHETAKNAWAYCWRQFSAHMAVFTHASFSTRH
jgi:hypothetical protein